MGEPSCFYVQKFLQTICEAKTWGHGGGACKGAWCHVLLLGDYTCQYNMHVRVVPVVATMHSCAYSGLKWLNLWKCFGRFGNVCVGMS